MYQLSPDPPGTEPETVDAGLPFEAQLKATTPNVRITWLLVGMNVAVFVAMVVAGTSVLSPSIPSLLSWGANYGPDSLGAQPWRLVTHVFVHVGILHLGLNMFVLIKIGPLIERMFGSRSFAVLYLCAGVCGGLLSVAIHPSQVSAGASGALFGLYGALGAFLWRQRAVVSPLDLKRISRTTVGFILGNLVMGFQVAGIDNGAHIGGLLGGALCGLVLVRPLALTKQPAVASRLLAQVIAATFAAALLVRFIVPAPVDVLRQIDAYEATQAAALAQFNELMKKLETGTMSEDETADQLEREVLPAWREGKKNIANYKLWPAPQSQLGQLLFDYVSAYESWWTELQRALRTKDSAAGEAALRHRERGDALGQRIGAWKP